VSERLFAHNDLTIIGVLNLTPDSFSDGGRFVDAGCSVIVESVLVAARSLVDDGAGLLDLGGESSRPGAAEVSAEEEISRTRPVIEALREAALPVPVSIDTRKSAVAEAAALAGAEVINDVSGLSDLALAEVAAAHDCHLILGHMRGTPADMQQRPHYDDVLREVASELQHSVDLARRAGVRDDRLAIDPGIGFGKRLEDNLELMVHGRWLRERIGLPVVLGPSRKSFLGSLTGDPVAARDTATHAACAVAAFAGVDALRVHDVAGAVRAVAVGRALSRARRKELS
jgi:dihydropteroate synthase